MEGDEWVVVEVNNPHPLEGQPAVFWGIMRRWGPPILECHHSYGAAAHSAKEANEQ